MNERGVIRLSNGPELVLPTVTNLLQDIHDGCSRQDAEAIRTGLVEMIMNAIEHGNLAIGYENKRQALENGSFDELVGARRHQQPYASRHVMVEYCHGPTRAAFTIRDQGAGFDWHAVVVPKIEANLAMPHGRGLLLAREKRDKCVFHQPGNAVTLVKEYATS